jgi:hypothetical protein
MVFNDMANVELIRGPQGQLKDALTIFILKIIECQRLGVISLQLLKQQASYRV